MPTQREITTDTTKLEDFPVPPLVGILGAGVIKLCEAFIKAARETCSVGRSGAPSFRSAPPNEMRT
jgi:hypothetical protein